MVNKMIKHNMTKYRENGSLFIESWLQIDLFRRCYCFSRKKYLVDKRGNAIAC